MLVRMANEFDITIALASWTVTVFGFSYGVSQLLFGPLGDRYGKVRVVSYGCAACSLSALLCAMMPDFDALIGQPAQAAIAQGRAKAFQIIYRRLTRQADWTRQPALDLPGLLRISRGYSVANERRSTTRYVADVTYAFNPDAVARLLRGARDVVRDQLPGEARRAEEDHSARHGT